MGCRTDGPSDHREDQIERYGFLLQQREDFLEYCVLEKLQQLSERTRTLQVMTIFVLPRVLPGVST